MSMLYCEINVFTGFFSLAGMVLVRRIYPASALLGGDFVGKSFSYE